MPETNNENYKSHRYFEIYQCFSAHEFVLPDTGCFFIENEYDWAIAQSHLFALGHVWRTELHANFLPYAPANVLLLWDVSGLSFSNTLNYSAIEALTKFKVGTICSPKSSMAGHLAGMSYGI